MKVLNLIKSGAAIATMAAFFSLGGCSKPPVKIVSAQMVTNLDKGSGHFDRVLEVCFAEPLQATYYHRITILSKEDVKISGAGDLKPMASDPDNPCYPRNLYMYINKDSPVDAKQLIKDYLMPGNLKQVLIQVYTTEPEGKELPIAERLFENL